MLTEKGKQTECEVNQVSEFCWKERGREQELGARTCEPRDAWTQEKRPNSMG